MFARIIGILIVALGNYFILKEASYNMSMGITIVAFGMYFVLYKYYPFGNKEKPEN